MRNNYSMVTEKLHGKTIKSIDCNVVNFWVFHLSANFKSGSRATSRVSF